MAEIKIIYKKIADLKFAEYNPRQISVSDFEHLKKSLEKFAAVDPAIINILPERKNVIIGGHQRIRAAQALGWTEFPCVEVSLSESRERELNIRLNKNTGSWDWDLLADNFEIEDLKSWGFDEKELLKFDDINFEAESQAPEDGSKESITFTVVVPMEKVGDFKNLMNHNKGLYEKISQSGDGDVL
jgi:hypothetical protein